MRLTYKDKNFKEYCSITTVPQLTQKLGEYEDIDESPEHLAKVKRVFDIIKKKGVNVGNFKDMLEDWKDITFKDYLNYRVENGYELQNDYDTILHPLTEEEFNLLKENFK